MRHRITIQRRETSYDNLGHESEVWSPIAGLYAEVKELSGRELERARQLVPEATVQVTTRASEILQTDRILFKGRVLQIASVVPDVLNTSRVCLCSEVKA